MSDSIDNASALKTHFDYTPCLKTWKTALLPLGPTIHRCLRELSHPGKCRCYCGHKHIVRAEP